MKKIFFLSLLILCSGLLYSQDPGAEPLHLPTNTHRQLITPAVIFLDFDGGFVSGINWTGSDFIAAPSLLTSSQIDTVLKIVREDFSPFIVDITLDSTVPNSQQVLITTTDFAGSSGGISYVRSWGTGIPNFAFTNHLLYNARFVGEAISHELGHALGLSHQSLWRDSCILVTPYNPGQGSGILGWAPLMGVSYYKNRTTWHRGLTQFDCSYIQDDLGIINQILEYRPATSRILGSSFNIQGIVSRDPDLYTLTMGGSLLHIQVDPVEWGNLDPRLEILDSGMRLIDIIDPPGSLSLVFDTLMSAGTYFLRISGAGNINASSYGSKGGYRLSGSATGVVALREESRINRHPRINKRLRISGGILEYYHDSRLPDEWILYDMKGSRLRSGRSLPGINRIRIQDLPRGIYIWGSGWIWDQIFL